MLRRELAPTVIVFFIGLFAGGFLERTGRFPDIFSESLGASETLRSGQVVARPIILRDDGSNGLRISSGKHDIVVFTDYDCPYCRRFHHETLPKSGVGVLYRNWPLSIHPKARDKAVLVECAAVTLGDSDASLVVDEIFEGATAWEVLDSDEYGGGALRDCFTGVEVDRRDLVDRILRADSLAALQLGLKGTPSVVIGDRVFSGLLGAEDLIDLVSRLLG